MKHLVYALYSPLYEMVKIGKSSNLENRWKQLSHWNCNVDKSFALSCNSKPTQKRIEDTLKEFFKLHPSVDALSTNQDGHTECFDECIMEDIRDFFQYFDKRYFHDYTYIEDIKPFLNFSTNNHVHKVIHPLVHFADAVSKEIEKPEFSMKILSKSETIDFLGIDPADF